MTRLVITGAGRGIGWALTRRAIERGDTVFAMVRQPIDATHWGESTPNLYPIVADVADTPSVERAFAQVDRHLFGEPLDAVINSAAISVPGAIEITPVSEYENILNTNALGSVRILREAIPRLRGHGGRMIFITSLWGRASGAMLSAYCMSKHAIESLADVARRETSGMNLHVIVVEPGVVRTDMYKLQGPLVQEKIDKLRPQDLATYGPLYQRYLSLVGGAGGDGVVDQGITADQCAADIEHALFDPRPEARYQSGDDARRLCELARNLTDREMDAVMLARLNNDPLPAGD